MNNEIWEKVKEFVVRMTAVDDEEVTKNTSLQNDLGIYGDDAVDFILAFSKEFKVDVSNFRAADYFNPEGIDTAGAFENLFSGKKPKQKKDLTISDLEKAIGAGRLDEEVLKS